MDLITTWSITLDSEGVMGVTKSRLTSARLKSSKTGRVSDTRFSEAAPRLAWQRGCATWGILLSGDQSLSRWGKLWSMTGGQGSIVSNYLSCHICNKCLEELTGAKYGRMEPWGWPWPHCGVSGSFRGAVKAWAWNIAFCCSQTCQEDSVASSWSLKVTFSNS